MPEKITIEEAEALIREMLIDGFPATDIRKIMHGDHSMSYSQTNSILTRIEAREPETDVVYFDGHPLGADVPEQVADNHITELKKTAIRQDKDGDVKIGFIILCIGLAAFLISYFAKVDGFGGSTYIAGMGSILYGGWRLNRGLRS